MLEGCQHDWLLVRTLPDLQMVNFLLSSHMVGGERERQREKEHVCSGVFPYKGPTSYHECPTFMISCKPDFPKGPIFVVPSVSIGFQHTNFGGIPHTFSTWNLFFLKLCSAGVTVEISLNTWSKREIFEKKKEEIKPSPCLCRLAVCWGSKLSQAVHKLWFRLHFLSGAEPRNESVSSEYVSCLGHVHGFLNSQSVIQFPYFTYKKIFPVFPLGLWLVYYFLQL